MFAPASSDFENGVRTFTGDLIRSRAGISHVLGEEACRSLILLRVSDTGIRNALRQATLGIQERVDQAEAMGYEPGMYCCGTCSVAYWRHVAAGGLDRNEERLTAAVKALRSHRSGAGRWRRFPFAYTLLALSEMELDLPLEEMRYAAPVLELLIRRPPLETKSDERKRTLFERTLARC
jgi:hypothetical protein